MFELMKGYRRNWSDKFENLFCMLEYRCIDDVVLGVCLCLSTQASVEARRSKSHI